MTDSPSEETHYVSEGSCCSICDRKKVCHLCGAQTLLACSDCRISLGATVHVCGKKECRLEHDRRCPGQMERTRARYQWAANELLACDYGDNPKGNMVGWIVYGWRDRSGRRDYDCPYCRIDLLQAAEVTRAMEAVEYEEKIDRLRTALLDSVEVIQAWHNMGMSGQQASAMWDIYWRNAPEMRTIREALKETDDGK